MVDFVASEYEISIDHVFRAFFSKLECTLVDQTLLTRNLKNKT